MIAFALTPALGPLWYVLTVVASIVAAGALSLTPRDRSLRAKAAVRAALAIHGVTHAHLASHLGVSVAIVDAALSDARENAVPLWWLTHPGFPAPVRAHVIEEITYRTTTAAPPSETPELLTQHALTRVGQFVTMASATMSPGVAWCIGAEAAAQMLRQVTDTIAALGGLASRLHRRVDTGRHMLRASSGARL